MRRKEEYPLVHFLQSTIMQGTDLKKMMKPLEILDAT